MSFVARSFTLQGGIAIKIGRTPEVAAGDCCYTISAIDCFSKQPEVAITTQVTSTAVIKFLLKKFHHEGNPKETGF